MNSYDYTVPQYSLSPYVAKNLSNTTNSVPMMESVTPRWLLAFLPWVSVEAGIYRINRVKKSGETREDAVEFIEKLPDLHSNKLGEHEIPQSFVDYDEEPKEHTLSLVQTILRVNGQVTDLFNSPINQLKEQMRLTVETMKEKQEWEIINNKDMGLVNSVHPSMRLKTRKGAPTPDDMDELLAKVWKKPAFFLAHPKAIAAFGRECTYRGVPPATVNLYGSPFLTWRGVPIVPCDKLPIEGECGSKFAYGTTSILLMRVGEKEQGVIGLHQPNVCDESCIPSMSVRFGGINKHGIASYIMTLYFGTAVLTSDSLGMLENVEIGRYHDYE